VSSTLTAIVNRTASAPFLGPVKRLVRPLIRRDGRIPVGSVRWGDLRRQQPISADFGYSRGSPVDRHYIASFLATHADDICGRVLEIKDPGYTRRFGGSRVERSDVLDFNPANKAATIIADLNDPKALENAAYDCVILTQTLQYLFEPAKAVRNLHRSLKPGGVLLLTVPGITPLRESGAPWYWNFTDAGVERLLREQFGPADLMIRPCGNLASVTAFLHGMAAGELGHSELERCDPAYQVVIVARAVKAKP
jgi:SAM-dependent methyltransferase